MAIKVDEIVRACKSCKHRQVFSAADCDAIRSPEDLARFSLNLKPCPNCKSQEANLEIRKQWRP